MQHHQVSLSSTGYFSKLMLDYLAKDSKVKPFYHHHTDHQGFDALMKERTMFDTQRKVLVSALNKQYEQLKGHEHLEVVLENIKALDDEHTFTVTTGHQLCLFTGPLYMIYKIVNTINLAKKLKEEFPDKNFVPVFWMASEDHDFEEVNHIHFEGHKLAWNNTDGGAVGRLSLESMAKVLDELEFRLPTGKRGNWLNNLFRNAYEGHQTLAEANRYLVHHLFGKEGLVIIDGDDVELKRLMVPYFQKELEGISENNVNESNQKISKEGYKVQVNPRDINLFYLRSHYRERITLHENGYETADGKYRFSKPEILEELNLHPERFSPNVILRPLYQEVLLPNLAYIGGGGELAYWLQLKSNFQAFEVPFPILRVRNSVLLMNKRWTRKLEKVKLSLEELFQSYDQLSKMYIQRECQLDDELIPIRDQWNSLLSEMETIATSFDQSLKRSVEALRAKSMKGMLQLEKKMIRSAKRKDDDGLRMINELKEALFPNGGLQERHDNFSSMYLAYGEDYIENLLSSLDPLSDEFSIFFEE